MCTKGSFQTGHRQRHGPLECQKSTKYKSPGFSNKTHRYSWWSQTLARPSTPPSGPPVGHSTAVLSGDAPPNFPPENHVTPTDGRGSMYWGLRPFNYSKFCLVVVHAYRGICGHHVITVGIRAPQQPAAPEPAYRPPKGHRTAPTPPLPPSRRQPQYHLLHQRADQDMPRLGLCGLFVEEV